MPENPLVTLRTAVARPAGGPYEWSYALWTDDQGRLTLLMA